MKRLGRAAGATLVELLVSMSVFSIIMAILAVTLRSSHDLLRETVGSSDSNLKMRKLFLELNTDLSKSSFAQSATLPTPPSPGSGSAGDAVWFLSARDPASGETLRKADGTPFWQRNILYYATVPSQHAALYGSVCAGGSNAAGYDSHCPHKFLVRKVIDSGAITLSGDEATEEQLLSASAVATHLSPPADFNVSLAGESGLEEARVVGNQLLTFRVSRVPVVPASPTEIAFDIKAIPLRIASANYRVGVADLEREGPD